MDQPDHHDEWTLTRDATHPHFVVGDGPSIDEGASVVVVPKSVLDAAIAAHRERSGQLMMVAEREANLLALNERLEMKLAEEWAKHGTLAAITAKHEAEARQTELEAVVAVERERWEVAMEASLGPGGWVSRALTAEMRQTQLEADVERLRTRTHEIAEAKDAEHREEAKEYARLREAVDRARERVRNWKADWTADPRSQGPEGWWHYTSHNHAMEAVALVADRNDALTRVAGLEEGLRGIKRTAGLMSCSCSFRVPQEVDALVEAAPSKEEHRFINLGRPYLCKCGFVGTREQMDKHLEAVAEDFPSLSADSRRATVSPPDLDPKGLHAALDHMRGANRDVARREVETIVRAYLAAREPELTWAALYSRLDGAILAHKRAEGRVSADEELWAAHRAADAEIFGRT